MEYPKFDGFLFKNSVSRVSLELSVLLTRRIGGEAIAIQTQGRSQCGIS